MLTFHIGVPTITGQRGPRGEPAAPGDALAHVFAACWSAAQTPLPGGGLRRLVAYPWLRVYYHSHSCNSPQIVPRAGEPRGPLSLSLSRVISAEVLHSGEGSNIAEIVSADLSCRGLGDFAPSGRVQAEIPL